jgi:hypothetical protein
MAEHPQAILDTMDQVEQEMRRAEQSRQLKTYGVYALIAVGVLGIVIGFSQNQTLLIIGGFVFIIAGFVVRSALKGSASPKKRFEAARQILRTLRDDTGAKGRVVGQLDLTDPRQDQKKVRTSYAAAGKRKEYYRDPWFRVKIKLVDGNLLHLSLEDRVKVKTGKRGFVNHLTQFSVKLVVNLELYRIAPISSGALPVPNAVLSGTDGVFSITGGGFHPDRPPVDQMLETVKTLYSHLEPIGTSPQPGGSDV